MKEEAPDSSDLDALKELVRSPGWALVSERMKHQIRLMQSALEAAKDMADVARCQGSLAAMRLVLRLPEILQDEVKSKL